MRLLSVILMGFILMPLAAMAQAPSPTSSGPVPLFSTPADPNVTNTKPTITLVPNLIKSASFSPETLVTDIIRFVLDLLTTIASIIAFYYILFGGIKYLMAGPNPGPADEGRKMIVGAVVGLVIIALSYLLVQYVISEAARLAG
jgi:hypothetical protein